eukprot:200627_1
MSNETYVVHLDNEFEVSKFGSKRKLPDSGPFKSHMSSEEADKIRENDRIDYRRKSGIVLPSIILEKNGTILTLCFASDDQKTENDQCDYSKSLNKIAKLWSISARDTHRLKEL